METNCGKALAFVQALKSGNKQLANKLWDDEVYLTLINSLIALKNSDESTDSAFEKVS